MACVPADTSADRAVYFPVTVIVAAFTVPVGAPVRFVKVTGTSAYFGAIFVPFSNSQSFTTVNMSSSSGTSLAPFLKMNLGTMLSLIL